MDENCVITPCEKEEYEEPIVPTPTESDLVQVYDSIDQITNPNSNHIYVVGNDTYVFDGVSFVSISGCDIPVYAGEYTVTAPSDGELVLPTKDKLMDDDLTINANHEIEDAILQNTAMDEYVNNRITVLPVPHFMYSKIKVIRLYSLETASNSTFNGGGNSLVEEIYCPNLSSPAYSLFEQNPNLKVVNLGSAFGSTTIRNNPNLKTIIFTKISGIIAPWASGQLSGTPFDPTGTGGYVYVPQALLSQYQSNANWQNYANVLEFRPIEGSEYEIEGLESTNISSQSFSLNSPLTDNFDTPLETFDTPLEDEFIPTEELESEE